MTLVPSATSNRSLVLPDDLVAAGQGALMRDDYSSLIATIRAAVHRGFGPSLVVRLGVDTLAAAIRRSSRARTQLVFLRDDPGLGLVFDEIQRLEAAHRPHVS